MAEAIDIKLDDINLEEASSSKFRTVSMDMYRNIGIMAHIDVSKHQLTRSWFAFTFSINTLLLYRPCFCYPGRKNYHDGTHSLLHRKVLQNW
jgi:hypothetical protein